MTEIKRSLAAQQSRNQSPDVTPAKAGVQNWIPAGAGMTFGVDRGTKFVQAAKILAFSSTESISQPLRPWASGREIGL
jgi:hypothetical protein